MKPVWQDSHGELWQGHVLAVLAALPERSVQCVVTSPPYWGLRAYGTDPQVWGNHNGCEHEWAGESRVLQKGTISEKQSTHAGNNGAGFTVSSDSCRRCQCWRGELGSEPTVTQYIANLVEVFRGVWRVLRDEGTLWVNLGSSYAGSHGNGYQQTLAGDGPNRSTGGDDNIDLGRRNGRTDEGYKPKDLILTPFLLAEALRQDGWYLRSAITLCKVAPMPESVVDRPTSATEMLFLLSKQERYFYDADAVRQPLATPLHAPGNKTCAAMHAGPMERGGKSQWERDMSEPWGNPAGANLRNWWPWHPEPSRVAHFASFPTHIPRRAILAGTSERGACPACGAPWRRVTDRSFQPQADVRDPAKLAKASNKGMDMTNGWGETPRGTVTVETTGWAPTCACDAGDPVPCRVLDPFVGSGTTVAVARALGRYGIGIDLNPEYIAQTRRRVQQGVLL